MNQMSMKVEVHLKCHSPFCLSSARFVCRWSVQSLYGKEIVQHHVSQQQLGVSLGGTVRVSVCTSEEEAPESSQPGWAGQLRLWCQYDYVGVIFIWWMDHHTIPLACAGENNAFLMYCTTGWFCWANINKQLQRGYIFDGWHVPGVDSGKEKYNVNLKKKKKKINFWSLHLQVRFIFVIFVPQQRPPCSCPYPRHPSQSGVRPPRGDTPLRRRPRPMFDSFCRPPNTAPSLWWVYAAYPQSSAFHIRWFRPSGTAVQWLALLPHKKMGCGFNSYAWGQLELAGSSGVSASVLFWHSGFLPQR